MASNGMDERRHNVLDREEFREFATRLEHKFDQLSEYQRIANGRVATAYEKLATLEERSQNQKDAPARYMAVIGAFIGFVGFIVSLVKLNLGK